MKLKQILPMGNNHIENVRSSSFYMEDMSPFCGATDVLDFW